jgi:tetratricopeptide (TPR) repeat protein
VELNLEKQISQCLESVDFEDELYNMNFDRCPGTSSWVLNDPNFVEMIASDKSACLFLCGSPGSGKTFLLYSIISHLQDAQFESEDDALAYFFCDNKVEGLSKRSALAVLKTFLAQLLNRLQGRKPGFVQATLQTLTSLKEKTQKMTLSQFHAIFTRVVRLFKVTYLVLDALDECDDWRQVLEILSRLLQDGTAKVKLVISSRNTSGIPHAVSKMPIAARFEVAVGPETTSDDIRKFIDWRIGLTADVRDLGTDESARNTLVEGSQGLFLLARLRFNALEAQILSHQTDLKSAVQDLPKEIYTYYEQALERLNGEDLRMARQIFLWVLFAQVPLSVDELIEATALQEDAKSRGEAKRLTLLGIEHLGAGLTVIVGEKVQLAHATVKDFAAAYQWNRDDQEHMFQRQHTIHSDISTYCVAYLTIPQLVTHISSSKNSFESTEKQWPLLRYSSNYWLTHLSLSTPTSNSLITAIFDFFRSEAGLAWWKYYSSTIFYYDWWSIPVLSSQFTAWAHHNDISRLSFPSNYQFIMDLCERHMTVLETTQELEDAPAQFITSVRLSEQMFNVGRITEGERLLKKAIDTNKKVGRYMSSETLSAMSDLCQSFCERGYFDEAETLAREVLTICEQSHSKDHRDYIHALKIIGDIKRDQHYFVDALKINIDNLAIARKAWGNEDPTTLIMANSLAITYVEMDRINDAEELMIEIPYAAILGNEHPSTLTGMENIASIYGRKGRIPEEIAIREEMSAKRNIIQGSKNIETASTIVGLATAYISNGDIKQAKDILDGLLQSTAEWLSMDHPIVLRIQAEYANAIQIEGCFDEAIQLRHHVLSERTRLLGKEHIWTIFAMLELGLTLQKQGNLEKAENLQSEVLAKLQLRFGDDHVDVINSMGHVASIKKGQMKLKEAEKMEEQVLHLLSKQSDQDSSSILHSKSRLSAIKQAMGKLNVAEKMREELLDSWMSISGPGSSDFLDAKALLAETKMRLQKEEEGVKLQEQVLEGRRLVSPVNSPAFLRSLENLASTYSTMDRLEEAEKMEEQVLAGWVTLARENSPFVLNAMSSLAITLRRLGKLDRAQKLQEQVLNGKMAVGEGGTVDYLTALEDLAITLQKSGDSLRVKEMQEQVLEGRKKLGEEDDPNILISMGNLAITSRLAGHAMEAERMEEHILKCRKKIEDEDSPNILIAMANLAITKRELGKYGESTDLQQKVLEVRMRKGPEDPKTLDILGALALTKSEMGLLTEALEIEKQVLEIRKKKEIEIDVVLSKEETSFTAMKPQLEYSEEADESEDRMPKTSKYRNISIKTAKWIAMGNLAKTKLKMGDRNGAEKLEEEISLQQRDILGESNTIYLETLDNLAHTKLDLRKANEAEKLCRKVLNKRKETLGEDNLLTMKSLHTLSKILMERGKFEEAEISAQKALKERRKILGDESSLVLNTMITLSKIFYVMDRQEESLRLQQEVLEVRKRCLGDENILTLNIMGNVGKLLSELGRAEEAEPIVEHVLEHIKKSYQPENEEVLLAMQNLAAAKTSMGKGDEAEVVFTSVLETRLRIYGESHHSVWLTMEFLGLCKTSQKKYDEAEKIEQQGVALRRKYAEETSSDYIRAVANLGKTKEDLGKLDEAAELYIHLIGRMEEHLLPDSLSLLFTLEDLANVYRKQKKFVEATELQRQVVTKRRETSAVDDADLLSSLRALAVILQKQGILDEAEELQTNVFAACRAKFGEDNKKTLNEIEFLISIKRENKKLEEAEIFARLLLEKRKAETESPIVDVVKALDILAWILFDQGRQSEGIVLEEEGYKLSCEKYGTDNVETLDSLEKLAWFNESCGLINPKVELYQERTLALHERLYPKMNDSIITSIWNLAITKLKLVKGQESLALFTRLLLIDSSQPDLDVPSPVEIRRCMEMCLELPS